MVMKDSELGMAVRKVPRGTTRAEGDESKVGWGVGNSILRRRRVCAKPPWQACAW